MQEKLSKVLEEAKSATGGSADSGGNRRNQNQSFGKEGAAYGNSSLYGKTAS